MEIILDASALLSGKFTSMPPGKHRVMVTGLVCDEIEKGEPRRQLDRLLEAGLIIMDPDDLDSAVEAAQRTGDIDSLSDPDLSVIALAIEMKDPVVLTDDFRIQNVLKKLDIPFESGGEIGDRTITEQWSWTFRCTGCGRYFDEGGSLPDCPICGSRLKRARRNR